jgi:hypothetical protein
MANDPFYNTALGTPWSELSPAERRRILASTNGTYGKNPSQTFDMSLYRGMASTSRVGTVIDEASDLRRFTVVRPAGIGKTQAVDQAALDKLREYVMMDLVGAGIVRTDRLPPRDPLAIQVHAICCDWGMAYRVG